MFLWARDLWLVRPLPDVNIFPQMSQTASWTGGSVGDSESKVNTRRNHSFGTLGCKPRLEGFVEDHGVRAERERARPQLFVPIFLRQALPKLPGVGSQLVEGGGAWRELCLEAKLTKEARTRRKDRVVMFVPKQRVPFVISDRRFKQILEPTQGAAPQLTFHGRGVALRTD